VRCCKTSTLYTNGCLHVQRAAGFAEFSGSAWFPTLTATAAGAPRVWCPAPASSWQHRLDKCPDLTNSFLRSAAQHQLPCATHWLPPHAPPMVAVHAANNAPVVNAAGCTPAVNSMPQTQYQLSTCSCQASWQQPYVQLFGPPARTTSKTTSNPSCAHEGHPQKPPLAAPMAHCSSRCGQPLIYTAAFLWLAATPLCTLRCRGRLLQLQNTTIGLQPPKQNKQVVRILPYSPSRA
jgi:hypothetical protein